MAAQAGLQELFELRMANFNWRPTLRPGFTRPGEWKYSFRRQGKCPILAAAMAMNPAFASTASSPNLQINYYDQMARGFRRHHDGANAGSGLIYTFGKYTGGQLILEMPAGPTVIGCHRKWTHFDGRYHHTMTPVESGRRFSAILYDRP